MPRGGLARVAPLLRAPRYEVFPAAGTEQAVLDWVPRELTVTVTAAWSRRWPWPPRWPGTATRWFRT